MKNQDMFHIEKELNHCSMKSLFGLEKCKNVTTISGYNLPRFWEVTWLQTYSTVLGRNITEVEPTNLRQDQVYIEVGC